MADQELSIQIETNAKKAVSGLNEITDSIKRIETTLSGISGALSTLGNIGKTTSRAINNLAETIKAVHPEKFSELSKAITSSAKSAEKTGDALKKTAAGAEDAEQAISRVAKALAKDFNISGAKNINDVKDALKDYYNIVNELYFAEKNKVNAPDEYWEKLFSSVKKNKEAIRELVGEYGKFENVLDGQQKAVLNWIKDINKSGNKISLGDVAQEYVDDFARMRATLGKAFVSGTGHYEFDSFIKELNATLNTNFSDNVYESFGELVEYVKRAKDSFVSLYQSIGNDKEAMDAFEASVDAISNDIYELGKNAGRTGESINLMSTNMGEAKPLAESFGVSLESAFSGSEGVTYLDNVNRSLSVMPAAIANVQNALGALGGTSLQPIDVEFQEVESEIEQRAIPSVLRFGESLDSLNNGNGFVLLQDFFEKVAEAAFRMDTATTATNNFDRAMAGMQKSMQPLLLEMKNYEEAVESVGEANQSVFGRPLKMYKPDFGDSEPMKYYKVEEAAEQASQGIEGFRRSVEGSISALDTLNSVISKFVGFVNGIMYVGTRPFAVMMGAINSLGNAADKVFSRMRSGWARVMRTFKFMLVRKAITAVIKNINEATKSLAAFDAEMGHKFNATMSLLVADFRYLGASIVGAFAPILNAVVPYLDILIEKLVEGINTANHFFAALTGASKYVIAKKVINDYAESTNEAADAQEKFNKQLAAFDKLNVLTTKETGGGAGNNPDKGNYDWKEVEVDNKMKDIAGSLRKLWEDGDFFDLGKMLSDKLIEMLKNIPWDKIYLAADHFGEGLAEFLNGLINPELFSELGRTIANSLNTVLHFLDKFGLNFDWYNFGTSLGAGLNSFMDSFDWEKALSVASTFGTGIANAINGFIHETDFYSVGEHIADVLNMAINFVFSMADTLDFGGIGTAIANAVNGFAKKFNAKKFGAAVNKWARGILKTAITALEKIKWREIGEKIGQFIREIDFVGILGDIGRLIWDAINAAFAMYEGMFETAPLETALATLGAALVLLKTDALTTFSTAVKGAISGLASFMSNAALNITGIFNLFKSGPVAAFDALKETTSGITRTVTGVVTAFLEFSIVKDTVGDLILGIGDLGTNIAELVGSIGVASAAFSVVFGFPGGVVAAALTACIAAFEAFGDVAEQIQMEAVGRAINDALTKPGGTPINELIDEVVKQIDSIGDSFDKINEGSAKLETTNNNIENVVKNIKNISRGMELGVIDTEKGIKRLEEAFDGLNTALVEKFKTIEETLTGAFSKDSYVGKALEELGVDVEGLRDDVIATSETAQEEITKMGEELKTLYESGYSRENNPRVKELEDMLMAYETGVDKLGEIAQGGIKTIENSVLDFSAFIDDEGNFKTEAFRGRFQAITNAITDTKDDVENAGKGLEEGLKTLYEAALKSGDISKASSFYQAWQYVPKVVKQAGDDTIVAAKTLTDKMQTEAIKGITDVVKNAQKEWAGLTDKDKMLLNMNEGEFVRQAVEKYQKGVIDPLSNELERQYKEVGIKGQGFASSAAQKIIEGMFTKVSSGSIMGVASQATATLKSNWKETIDSVTKESTKNAEDAGNDIGTGFSLGLWASRAFLDAKARALGKIPEDVIRDVTETHSPSAVMERVGGDLVEGLAAGLTRISSVLTSISDLTRHVMTTLSESFSTKNVTNALTGIPQGFSLAFQEARGNVREIISRISDMIDDFVRKTKRALDNLIAKMEKVASASGGSGAFEIPGFASGGIVSSGQIFMARENGVAEMVGSMGGHTAVANNDQIVAGIAQGVYSAVKRAMMDGGGNGDSADIVINMDGNEIYRVVRKRDMDFRRQTGFSGFSYG